MHRPNLPPSSQPAHAPFRQRPFSEQPIKFFARSGGSKAAFKLDMSLAVSSGPDAATAAGAAAARPSGRRAVLHLFHPVLPFVLSAVQVGEGCEGNEGWGRRYGQGGGAE